MKNHTCDYLSKWVLRADTPGLEKMNKRESLWTQGNGYMGIRASFEEEYANTVRDTLINGVFDQSKDEPAELANIPDTTNFELWVDGERFTMQSGKTENFAMELNMKNGEFTRNLTWTTSAGKKVDIAYKRFVSQTRKHIMAQTVEISSPQAISLSVVSGINGKVTNTGVQHFDHPQKRAYSDGIRGLYLCTLQSKVDVAVHYSLTTDHAWEGKTTIDRRSVFNHMEMELAAGESVTFTKFSSFATARDIEYTEQDVDAAMLAQDGIRYIQEAEQVGFEALRKENQAAWEAFWNDSLVEIKSGNEFLDRAILFAQYHLHIMASPDDNRLGIGGKALSGEGYGGHSFWDTEVFIFPYYLFHDPACARRLLEYRYKLLDVAKEKAKGYGYLGAMYPWESTWITDGEMSNQFGDLDLVTGERRQYYMNETEIHVTAGIAYAIDQYFRVTGDTDFMEKCGNEMLVLTALFWASRVEKKNGRYEILGVIGPDEYKEFVDNNAYTNYMAKKNLELAKNVLQNCPDALYKKLSCDYNVEEITKKIIDVAENLYLPMPQEDGIIEQFVGVKDLIPYDITHYKTKTKVFTMFYEFGFAEILKMQVFKQADLVMLFYVMRELFDEETIRKNFAYYEERTLHDSSLSMCIHALVAARLGMKEMANKLFFDSCCVDLGDNTDNSDAGIHSASIGGIWLATVMGYGGLYVTPEGLSLDPVLPDGWEEYSFYINYQGTKIKVLVNSDGCVTQRISGKEVKLTVYGEEQTVS